VGLIALRAWAVLLGLLPAHFALADEGSVDPAPNIEALAEVKIYCILDADCLGGLGHTGLIVDDGRQHWYISYGKWGFVAKLFPTRDVDEVFAYAKSGDGHNTYNREQHWLITVDQAINAKRVAAAEIRKKYKVLTHNCWHMVYNTIRSAVGGERIVSKGSKPGDNWVANVGRSDGASNL